MHWLTYTCTHMYTDTYKNAPTHANTYTRTHTYTQTYTHIHARARPRTVESQICLCCNVVRGTRAQVGNSQILDPETSTVIPHCIPYNSRRPKLHCNQDMTFFWQVLSVHLVLCMVINDRLPAYTQSLTIWEPVPAGLKSDALEMQRKQNYLYK